MRYLCMIFYDEAKLNALSEPELTAAVDEALDYDDVMREEGHYVTSGALTSVESSTTLRMEDGKMFITDGPFAETKEQIGGFIVIEARDLDEAIRVASRMPPAQFGGVELRPIRALTHSGKKH